MPEQLTTTEIEDLFSTTNETRYAAAQRLGIRNADRLTVEDYLIKVSDLLRQAGDSNALSRLQTLLGHTEVNVRVAAAAAIAAIEPALGLPILETLLAEDNRKVRSDVVKILCAIDGNGVPRILSRVLLALYQGRHTIDPTDDWTRDLRRKMTLALGPSGDSYAFDSLMLAAQDVDLVVRKEALLGLALLGDRRALPRILASLEDPHWEVRIQTVTALGEMGGEEVVDPIIKLLSDAQDEVVLAVIDTLALLKDVRAIPALLRVAGGESDRVARAAVSALSQVGSNIGTPVLLASLHHTIPEARVVAASVLGVAGGEEAPPALITVLRGDPDVAVRLAAARALGRLGNRRAVRHLIQALQDDSVHVHEAAVVALGSIGDAAAAAALASVAEGVNTTLATAARRALRQMGLDPAIQESPAKTSQRVREHAPKLLMRSGRFDERL